MINGYLKQAIENVDNIIIYGTGNTAETLCDDLHNYSILGILDSYKLYGEYCGHRIITWNDIEPNSNTVIIVATVPKYHKEIYFTIRDKCLFYGIVILDQYGNKLSDECWAEGNKENECLYRKKSLKQLYKQIESHDIISFDIFDTLVMRKILAPTDVFDMVEARAREKGILLADFKHKRVAADYNTYLGNIFDIYKAIKDVEALSKEEIEELITMEVECEKDLLVVRKTVLDAFNYAKALGKRVYLISDMYLTVDILKKLLTNLDIIGYKDIFVSCDRKKSKASGLYEEFKSLVKGASYLHIGDNKVTDYEIPQKYGFDTYDIKSAVDLCAISGLHRLLGCARSLNEKIIIGLLVAEMFNDPFMLSKGNGLFKVSSLKTWGKLCFAPVLIKYIMEIIKYVKADSNLDGVLFPARDGYLLNKMYEYYREHIDHSIPKSFYLAISRKAALRCCSDLKVIRAAGNKYMNGDYYTFLNNVLGISADDENITIDELESELVQRARRMAKAAQNYYAKSGITADCKYLFTEIYSKGTSQAAIDGLFKNNLKGFYLMRYGDGEYDIDIHEVYKIDQDNSNRCSLSRGELLFETFISGPGPALLEIREDGLIYDGEGRSAKYGRALEKVASGIEELFCEYLRLFDTWGEISNEMPEYVFKYKDSISYSGECRILGNIAFKNNYEK